MEPPLPVLLIEDDEVDREVVLRCLKSYTQQFNLTVIPDARQALTRLDRIHYSYAIIVLELILPAMDGFEFLYMLRHHPTFKDSIVIVLTASDSEQDRMRATHYQVAHYLLKKELDGHCTQLIKLLELYRRDRQRLTAQSTKQRL